MVDGSLNCQRKPVKNMQIHVIGTFIASKSTSEAILLAEGVKRAKSVPTFQRVC